MHAHLRGLAALVVLALALTGCSGDTEPGSPDPSEPVTSPAAPVSSAPTTTATSSSPTEVESAGDFLRRWHSVSDEMQNTGDASSYRTLGPDCKPCRETADLVESYYRNGGYVRAGRTKVLSVRLVGEVDGNYEYDVELDTPPSRYRETADGPIKSFPGGENAIRVQMKRMNDSWVVTDYGVLAS